MAPTYHRSFANDGSPRRKVIRHIIYALITVLISGCALVDEVSTTGNTKRSFVVLEPITIPPNKNMVVKLMGVGVSATAGNLTAGYFNNLEYIPDKSCQVILIGNSDEQLERFTKLFGKNAKICSSNLDGAD